MRACWLKWVGRDWSISADYIWLNYSGANNATVGKYQALYSGARTQIESLPCALRCKAPISANLSHNTALKNKTEPLSQTPLYLIKAKTGKFTHPAYSRITSYCFRCSTSMNSRESERSSSFAPTDRQGPKWPLHPRATGSGAPRSVPKCRQKRNVPICRLESTEEDGVCLLYTSPSPRDRSLSRMPSSA